MFNATFYMYLVERFSVRGMHKFSKYLDYKEELIFDLYPDWEYCQDLE